MWYGPQAMHSHAGFGPYPTGFPPAVHFIQATPSGPTAGAGAAVHLTPPADVSLRPQEAPAEDKGQAPEKTALSRTPKDEAATRALRAENVAVAHDSTGTARRRRERRDRAGRASSPKATIADALARAVLSAVPRRHLVPSFTLAVYADHVNGCAAYAIAMQLTGHKATFELLARRLRELIPMLATHLLNLRGDARNEAVRKLAGGHCDVLTDESLVEVATRTKSSMWDFSDLLLAAGVLGVNLVLVSCWWRHARRTRSGPARTPRRSWRRRTPSSPPQPPAVMLTTRWC